MRDPFGYSEKWHQYPEDVLPMWVADMDFPIDQHIKQALVQRLELTLGYPSNNGDPRLITQLLAWFAKKDLHFEPHNLWLTTSAVPAIYASVLGLTAPDDEVVTLTPVYYPFLNSVRERGRVLKTCPMVLQEGRWRIDMPALRACISPRTKLLMLCNPHNPTGRVLERQELLELADLATEFNLYIMVDELWSELIYQGQHISIASLSEDIAQRTVTINGPCKTYNFAGLGGGVVASHNPALLKAMQAATKGVMGHPNALAMAAWSAALEHSQPWLDHTLSTLSHNRTLIEDFAKRHPKLGYVSPESTYLAWMDVRQYGINANTLLQGKLALSEGSVFGSGFGGFVRMNFATHTPIVLEGLERLEAVLMQHA